ncbi:MAG: hypothetical protein O3B64_02805 [bacterium]|nr:hypothetical protein [bacterium]
MSFNFGQLPGYQPALKEIIANGRKVGVSCVTPVGFTHIEIIAEHASLELIDSLISERQPVTLAVNYPSRDQLAYLKQAGFYLRSEMVRWFAPVGDEKNSWTHLSSKRARKMRANIRKAQDHVRVMREPLSIENFQRWLPIYEKEVVNRPGGVRIFYCDLFLAGKKMTGLEMVSCFRKSDGVYVGGCIVNPWGEFSDIGGPEKKYTTFLMSALDASARPYAVGYLLDEVVMNIARKQGCKVYGHGADFNFWGTDILPGLLSRKSACGMLPVPTGKVQAFLVANPERALSLNSHYLLMEITGKDLVDQYLSQRILGTDVPADTLYGPVWEDPSMLRCVTNQMTIHRFRNRTTHIQLPEGSDVVDHELEF